MTTTYVDAFLHAKKHQARARLLFVGGVLGFSLGAVVAATLGGVVSAFVYFGLGFVFGFVIVEGSRGAGSRDRLLRIIEDQINRDPEALKYLAAKRSGAEQAVATDGSKTDAG